MGDHKVPMQQKQSTMIKKSSAAHKLGMKNGFSATNNDQALKTAKVIGSVVTNMEDLTAKTLRQGTEMCDDAFQVFDAAYRKMISREIDVDGIVKSHTAKIKDKANQVAEALAKIEKLAGVDFDAKLQRLERFATAVDTLDRLNKTGKLAECAKALAGLSGS